MSTETTQLTNSWDLLPDTTRNSNILSCLTHIKRRRIGQGGREEGKEEGREKRRKKEILKYVIILVFCSDSHSVAHGPSQSSQDPFRGSAMSKLLLIKWVAEEEEGGGRAGEEREGEEKEKNKAVCCVNICTEWCKRNGGENCWWLSTKWRQFANMCDHRSPHYQTHQEDEKKASFT